MTTVEERREVARLARALAKNEFDFECDSVAKAVGANRHFPAQAWGRLADLIDPGELKTTCIAEVKIEGEKLDEVVNRAIAEYTGIDRDALLELADEFDDKADYIASCIESMESDFDMHAVEAEAEQREYARRIREACGEVER